MTVDLGRLTIPTDATIRDALMAIDRGAAKIALVVNGDILVGTLTDGNVRRALLRGSALDDPALAHATLDPRTVAPTEPRANVLDLMRANLVEQVPVVDDRRRLVGLHLLRELLGAAERPNWAVVMAGGRGTRLGTITAALPKPLVPVAGRPILERIVLHLVGHGMRHIALTTNYLGEMIESHFEDGSQFGAHIQYIREEPKEPRGTAGSLAIVRDRLPDAVREPVLVMNGDVLSDFDVGALLAHHKAAGNHLTVAVKQHAYQVPFGVVDVNEAARVQDWREKPTASWTVGAGIYVVGPDAIEAVPDRGAYDLPTLTQDCVRNGMQVGVWDVEHDWIDIGRPEELSRARGESL